MTPAGQRCMGAVPWGSYEKGGDRGSLRTQLCTLELHLWVQIDSPRRKLPGGKGSSDKT